MRKISTALISVFNKDGIKEIATKLHNQNIKTEYVIESGIISLKINSQNNDKQESLVLEFSENPFSLKKWIIQDSFGENTTVLIQNAKYNNKLSHVLFFPDTFPEPNN